MCVCLAHSSSLLLQTNKIYLFLSVTNCGLTRSIACPCKMWRKVVWGGHFKTILQSNEINLRLLNEWRNHVIKIVSFMIGWNKVGSSRDRLKPEWQACGGLFVIWSSDRSEFLPLWLTWLGSKSTIVFIWFQALQTCRLLRNAGVLTMR